MIMELFSGCGSKEASESAQSKEAGDETTFTVGVDAEFSPYGYMDENGNYTGFDLERIYYERT